VTEPRLSLIVAVARNGVIGRQNQLPWRIPSDLKTFRHLTMGKPIIMGRRTFQSIGRPLDGRDNIVVTSDRTFSADGVEACASLDEALALGRRSAADRAADEIMVVGGADLFRATLPRADRLYWTTILADVDGDIRFPDFDRAAFAAITEGPITQGPRDDHPWQLAILDRIGSSAAGSTTPSDMGDVD
jgi:dihydrofolate reductase